MINSQPDNFKYAEKKKALMYELFCIRWGNVSGQKGFRFDSRRLTVV